jgi:hypothetical protein
MCYECWMDRWVGILKEGGHRGRGGRHHFGILVAIFLACSARGQVTSRLGKVLQMPDGRMGKDFKVGVMRRGRGGGYLFWCVHGLFFCAFDLRMGGVKGRQDAMGAGWMDGARF